MTPARAREILGSAPGVELDEVPTPLKAAGRDPSLRRPAPPGPGRPGRPRSRALHQQRQPAQGCRPQHRADRGAHRRRALTSALSSDPPVAEDHSDLRQRTSYDDERAEVPAAGSSSLTAVGDPPRRGVGDRRRHGDGDERTTTRRASRAGTPAPAPPGCRRRGGWWSRRAVRRARGAAGCPAQASTTRTTSRISSPGPPPHDEVPRTASQPTGRPATPASTASSADARRRSGPPRQAADLHRRQRPRARAAARWGAGDRGGGARPHAGAWPRRPRPSSCAAARRTASRAGDGRRP